VVREHRAGRLEIARPREPQPEVDAVALALGLQLRDLGAQLVCRLCRLGRLGHLRLQLRDPRVPLADGRS
jgi:hypothetical protein